jgi:hypothetical protein
MTLPLNVVLVPIPVAGQTWSKRTPQPQYPSQRRQTWPLHQSIPTDEARRMLDDARRRMTSERDQLKRWAREGLSS